MSNYKECIKYALKLLLALIMSWTNVSQVKANSTSKALIWRKLMSSYSKADPPTEGKNYATEVKLGIYINSFFSISESSMDYSISFYLRQAWNDPRLNFKEIDNSMPYVKLPDGSWDKIWVPDVFFRNEKEAEYHKISTANRLLKLYSNGSLWYVSKITATLSCPMMLKRYPFDVQSCPMMFESFGYTSDVMYFTWLDKPAEVDKGNQIPQFTLKDIITSDCSQNYTAGSFTCLQLAFILQRDTGFFLLQVYIPSMLVVILSWVSFWINMDAVPARVSVGLITVLTLTTHSSTANSSLPKVSYVKAIDVWMSMCLVFVFIALLEYAFVNVISRGASQIHDKRKTADVHQQQIQMLHHSDTEDNTSQPMKSKMTKFSKCFKTNLLNPSVVYTDPITRARIKAQRVDKVSRILFPISFFLFNVGYWFVYTTRVIEV